MLKVDIDSLTHLTRIYSEDIGISFGLEKCDLIVVKRGKAIMTNGIDLPPRHTANIQNNKYLILSYSHMVTTMRKQKDCNI